MASEEPTALPSGAAPAPGPSISPASDPALSALVEQVRAARADGTALDIRGAGTKAFYGQAPVGKPLDTRALTGISSYEPTELVITARAGTPLQELEAALAEQGQCLPFEPPRLADPAVPGARGGTVGGMVAAGLAGPSRATAGGVRDFVLGATLLNGRAEVLSFGGQVMKNVAGYDVSRLLAGSMGILGVICEVSLKVLPTPAGTCTLRFEMEEATALRQLNTWGGRPLPLSGSAGWDGPLVLRLSGAQAAVQAAAAQLGGETVDPALAAGFWEGLRDQTDEFFENAQAAPEGPSTLWRVSVPSVAPPLGLPGDTLIEWGGAQRWLWSDAPAEQVRQAAAQAGGHATRFRGGDRTAGVFAPLSPVQERLHRGLKAAFDPDGIFNRGRLLPGL